MLQLPLRHFCVKTKKTHATTRRFINSFAWNTRAKYALRTGARDNISACLPCFKRKHDAVCKMNLFIGSMPRCSCVRSIEHVYSRKNYGTRRIIVKGYNCPFDLILSKNRIADTRRFFHQQAYWKLGPAQALFLTKLKSSSPKDSVPLTRLPNVH